MRKFTKNWEQNKLIHNRSFIKFKIYLNRVIMSNFYNESAAHLKALSIISQNTKLFNSYELQSILIRICKQYKLELDQVLFWKDRVLTNYFSRLSSYKNTIVKSNFVMLLTVKSYNIIDNSTWFWFLIFSN